MPKLHRLAAPAVALLLFVFCAAASATVVNLRVEGASKTYFEGQVDTAVHQVDAGDGTGPHECDGLNGGNPNGYGAAGPTETGALDDAAHANSFSWSGTWYPSFDDFTVDTIDGESGGSSTFWELIRNWTALQTGGCQQQVQAGDNLLIAISGFAQQPLLELSGAPATAAVGQQFTVHVVQHDGNGDPATAAAGATVAGSTTGADGNAVVSFSSAGMQTFKATRADAIRSNAQTVCVYTPGNGGCGTQPSSQTTTPVSTTQPAIKDTTPPVLKVLSLVAGKVYSRGPRLLAGSASDSGGLYQVFLRLRATSGGGVTGAGARCRWFSGKRGVFTHRSVPCANSRFFRIGDKSNWSYLLPGRLGKGSYVLDVKVLDRSFNAGRGSVPFAVR